MLSCCLRQSILELNTLAKSNVHCMARIKAWLSCYIPFLISIMFENWRWTFQLLCFLVLGIVCGLNREIVEGKDNDLFLNLKYIFSTILQLCSTNSPGLVFHFPSLLSLTMWQSKPICVLSLPEILGQGILKLLQKDGFVSVCTCNTPYN